MRICCVSYGRSSCVFNNMYWKICGYNSDMCCMVDTAILMVVILVYTVVFYFIAEVCLFLLTGVSKCWRKIVIYGAC